MLVLFLLPFPSAALSESISLAELISRFQEDGTSLVYSTALVDTSLIVEWNGVLTINTLRSVLQQVTLDLEEIEKRNWAIVKAQKTLLTPVTPEKTLMPVRIDHIVVTASRYEMQGEEHTSRYSIGDAQLSDIPAIGGDSLRIVHRLPGAASLGVTAKPNVRGGSDDELLVLFDGVELIEPFHLRDFQSMFSSFNPQTISSVEFYTGGFPARYGNKLSGVLDISTEDSFTAPGGELGLSAYSVSGLYYFENKRADAQTDRMLVSARRGNLDLVLRSDVGEPRYHDFYTRFTREMPGSLLKVSGFLFDDDLLFTSDESRTTSEVDNRYIWFEWERDASDIYHAQTFLTLGNIDSKRLGWTFAADDTQGYLRDDQRLDILAIKHLSDLRLNDDLKIDLGASITHYKMSYNTSVRVEKDIVAEFLQQPTTRSFDFRKRFEGNAWGVFTTVRYRPLDNLSLEAGLRFDGQRYGAVNRDQVSPRISLLLEPHEKWDFRLSYGRFHQPQGIHELATTDGEFAFQPPQKSDHYILAVEFLIGETPSGGTSRIIAEMFYKKTSNLKPRYINLFDPYVYVPELQQDRITVSASDAEAKGFELSFMRGSEAFAWNANYTYSKVTDSENGRKIDRRWDQTHSLNLFVNWRLGNWTLGAATAWHTGWATTRLPLAVPLDAPIDVSRYRNNDRLANYGTIDFKVSYEQHLSKSSLKYFIEVSNLVNRTNRGGIDYEIEVDDDEAPEEYVLQEVDLQPVFPLVTNIGVIWRF